MAKHIQDTVIYSAQPATFSVNKWLDSSIVGNGKVGAAIVGAYANERILVNHALMKSGGYTGVLQDVSDKFPAIRKAYSDGKVLDAAKVLSAEFAKRNYKPAPELSMPLCVLTLDFLQEGLVNDYKRITDMESGEVTVEFRAKDTTFTRSLCVHRTSDTVCFETAVRGTQKINVNLGCKIFESFQNATIKYESGYIYFAARGNNNADFGLVARIIIPGGNVVHHENGILIKDADSLTIFAKPFVGGNREAKFKELKAELGGIKNTYSKMQSASEAIHRRMFTNATLRLNDNNTDADMATLVEGGLSAHLISRLWNFAKYMVICGYGNFISPTGLWCGETDGCSGVVSFDNTAQLLYGGVVGSFDADAVLALFFMYEKYADDLKKNASRVYGARGYFVPNVISPDSALFGATNAETLHFIASSALCANLVYNYFLQSGDAKTLKSRIFPFMKEVFNFYSDFLKLDNSGFYSTMPSYSPNSTPGNVVGGKPLDNFAFAVNSTIDFLAVSALLDNLIHAAGVLGGSTADVAMWCDMRAKIPQYSVGDTGALREYTNSAFIDGAVNCGNMHGYGLWPLKTFSFNDQVVPYKPAVGTTDGDTISLKFASANAALQRIKNSSHVQDARTLAMYAVQMAHAHDVGAVTEMMERLTKCLSHGGMCLTNDFRGSGFTKNTRPCLDISGNMGFATAVTECLIQSDTKTLRVLPTLLGQFLAAGQITNIATDFAATVSMDWDMKKGKLIVKILPKATCKIDIFFHRDFRKLKDKNIKLDKDNSLRDVKLTTGKQIVYEFV